ncbi:MAG: aminoacyl-histidine dipeptidase [Oscillospiraceae bacterium]|nr:aminoacyl-histidine dipeptidase [Oscillospiraceae bacterium]
MPVLDQLEPKKVFSFFEQLCAIPHGSGNTKAASDWIARFAKERGLWYLQDSSDNVIVKKPASSGYENAAPVILQGHIDMVCEKSADCAKDMAREGLELAVDGDVIYAKGTTLGGDDGIAVAMLLAVLDDDKLAHPPIEAVFTSDEEVGLLGAAALDASALQGRRLINLDSENEGIFTVSCAGGARANCRIPVAREAFAGSTLRITVDGLRGGHSGAEIDKGRANSSKLLGRVLWTLKEKCDYRLCSVRGGMADNAIPVLSEAVLAGDEAAARAVAQELERTFRAEYRKTDPDIAVRVERCESALAPMDRAGTENAVCFLHCCANGIFAMSADIEGLVQTSLNLGILNTEEDCVKASFSVRSSIDSQKQMLLDMLRCLTERLGGGMGVTGDYPGWAYRAESPLRDLMAKVYTEQYGKQPKIEAIHAGLECGLFAGKLDGLDCVSLGPDMEAIHTPGEKLHIASTRRTWELLVETLRQMK